MTNFLSGDDESEDSFARESKEQPYEPADPEDRAPAYNGSRITYLGPGMLVPEAIDAASSIVLAAPDIDHPERVLVMINTPSDVHLIQLAGAMLAQVKKNYGDVGLRRAIEAERYHMPGDYSQDRLPPAPKDWKQP